MPEPNGGNDTPRPPSAEEKKDRPKHSVYADGVYVYEGEQPGRVKGPDPSKGNPPHWVIVWDPHPSRKGRIYKAREYVEKGVPIRDVDFTNPTFPNGIPRPNHPGPPHQHEHIPNIPGNPKAGFYRSEPLPVNPPLPNNFGK